jgi:hypothetical protein
MLFFIFAVPVGYVFGGVPALLAGAIYSAALAAMPTVGPRHLLRAGLGGVCGGLTCAIWFHAIVGAGSFRYATVGALTIALFALCRTGKALAGKRLHFQVPQRRAPVLRDQAGRDG